MKVLLVPLGSRGDVQPLVVLGEELRRRGHTVTLAAPPDFRAWIEGSGFAFSPVGEPIYPFLVRNSQMTEQHPARALPSQLRVLRDYTRQNARDLYAAKHQADIVVTAGLSFAGKALADQLGVPHVYCCYALGAVYSAEYPPALLPVFGLPRLGNRALWWVIKQTLDRGLGGVLNEARQSLGLPARRGSWVQSLSNEVLLTLDSVMGDLPSDAASGCVQVPALVPRPEAARPLSDLLERFLRGAGVGSNDASPVVYLGFGSMPSVDRAGVLRVARELFEQHHARVVLYSAHGEDAGADLPPGVFVTGDTDHQTLFPRVDLIVHHGGAGTTAAALRSGVPQVIVPHLVDQFGNGRRIAELGLGPAPVAKSSFNTAALAAALKDRFKYWAKAQSVRALVAQEGGAAAAAEHLERLVRERGKSAR